MNINTQQVFKRMLEILKDFLEKSHQNGIHPVFEKYFTRSEIIEMLTFVYSGNVEKQFEVVKLSNEQLLEHLSTLNILSFYLEAWEQEQNINIALTSVSVWQTLQQLGLQTHYLGQKLLKEWDEYDHNNYKSLQRKAGKTQRVFGIYDAMVKQDDVLLVDKQPLRFYESEKQATEAMNEFCKQGNYIPDEVHILSLKKSI